MSSCQLIMDCHPFNMILIHAEWQQEGLPEKVIRCFQNLRYYSLLPAILFYRCSSYLIFAA